MNVDDLSRIDGTLPNFTIALGALVTVCGGLFLTAYARGWAPRLGVSLAVALCIRIAAVWIAYGHTPRDVASYFQRAGNLLRGGTDPMTHMPHFRWNFLPFMPIVFGAELKTGIAWELSGKIAPVVADLVLVVLLAKLAGADRGRNVALLYALCPLAFLISGVHGQVEPVALAFGVGGYLAARQGRPDLAGVAMGFAIAAKTWPVLLVPGLLRDIPTRHWGRALVGIAAVPLLFLLMIPVVLGDSLPAAVKVLAGYRSFVGGWGWAGLAHVFGWIGTGYAGAGIGPVQRVGSLLTAAALVTTVALLWKRADGVVLTAGLMLAFFAATAGFGVQYLLWPVPFVLLVGDRAGAVFVTLAGAYAATFYMFYEAVPALRGDLDVLLPVASVAVIVTGLTALPRTPYGNRQEGRACCRPDATPASGRAHPEV
ncbi:uncharacterized protein DUF2029 [Asanoa ferruginea]|uniref:Uncharacterized protein DUF2029 n=1 Tax=Asanoa ferruginea TaxID=53367 RepID=A0A3D9ZM51_9ACTN|nr:glycosyltransferase family 87 protein [Asanoa ferruginea]REF98281.1 uncharacterized protein DUF2029 [Asanoa ferruginea]GIF52017.1 hypothetical protein Afe04nite_65560 [Asanoa ferruginea]